jgi:hypothetical protein
MTRHFYIETERRQHLEDFIKATESLLVELEQSDRFFDAVPAYRDAMDQAKQFLEVGFTQDDLSRLSREAPQLFWLHPHWTPPLEESGGRSKEPDWFSKLEPLERRVTEAAYQLRVTGEYPKPTERSNQPPPFLFRELS